MQNGIDSEVREVICNAVKLNAAPADLKDDFRLAGENLDSMAVTNLVVGLEEHFGFVFDEDELTADAFETVASLTELVAQKVENVG